MTVEESFSLIVEQMVEGLMTHSQLANYFDFLGLKGYAKLHEYHYFEESNNYANLCRYYINHFQKMVKDRPFQNPNVIPPNWYGFSRYDVDVNVRQAGIRTGFEKWVAWEKEVKKKYEQHYQNLISLNEIAAANELSKYISDVDEELAEAELKLLTLKASNFNLSDIVNEQEHYFKKYKNRIKEIA